MENRTSNLVLYIDTNLSNLSESRMIQQLNGNMTAAVMPVTVFIGIETIVGLIGNILILLIYTKLYERSNFRCFVLSMAVVDLTSCLTTLPGEMFSQMNWYDYQYAWICKVKSYFNVFTAWGSASILLLLAFDRYRKICKPLAWQIQPSLARKLCGCSLAISAIVASPIIELWGKQTYMYEFEGHNLTVSICEKSDSYANDNYPLIYIGCVYIFPIGLILFVICSLNVLTVRKLFANKRFLSSKCRKLNSLPSDSVLTISTVCMEMDDKNSEQNETAEEISTTERTVIPSDDDFLHSCSGNKLETVSETAETISKMVAETQEPVRISVISSSYSLQSEIEKSQVTLESDVQVNFDIENRYIQSENTPCPSRKVTENSLYGSASGSQSASRRRHNNQQQYQQTNEARRKQKTIIMLVLTTVFVTTVLMYVILISFVAGTEGVLKDLSNSKKVVFFFFWRLYFINTLVNPVLYGFLDPRFRDGLKSLFSGNGLS